MVGGMVTYAAAPGDVETGPEERTVVLLEKKSSAGRMWKVSVAVLLVALCFVGILLFAWYWNTRPEMLTQSGQAEAVIEKHTAGKTDPQYTLRRISSKAKAAIHLEGSYDEDEDKDEEEEEVEDVKDQLEWRNGQGQAFAQGGFRLEDNQIVIPQTGLFFVYSQASFRVSCNDGDEKGTGSHLMPLSHRIWRLSDSIGSKASLMSAVRSACQNTAQEESYIVGQGWYNAIYLGAVFQLNRGDRLWTETNQLSALETEEGKTFFGVFAL
ncbi:tumor necrosis factor b (TNF superfamily, member 2) [Brachionichthys hirsutus]|uniref:tumor necrosis factor b (TNF superfamily, member 2) n=1 Tax=Brachionichthys hirsutus TaxID=412623 RepID=UPI0036047AE4